MFQSRGNMPPGVTIPESEYKALLREMKHGIELCGEVSGLRIVLLTFERQIPDSESVFLAHVRGVIEGCEEVARLRIEFSSIERRLREFDTELTPIRPASRTDIQMAFENSVDFATGKKKPPEGGPGRY